MNPSLKRYPFFGALIVTVLAAAACAYQPPPSSVLPPGDLELRGQMAGFVVGLFHGFTIGISMLASLFFDVRIYSFPNSGRIYDLGYLLGAAAFLEGSTRISPWQRDVERFNQDAKRWHRYLHEGRKGREGRNR
jgi:hypothetical protein